MRVKDTHCSLRWPLKAAAILQGLGKMASKQFLVSGDTEAQAKQKMYCQTTYQYAEDYTPGQFSVDLVKAGTPAEQRLIAKRSLSLEALSSEVWLPHQAPLGRKSRGFPQVGWPADAGQSGYGRSWVFMPDFRGDSPARRNPLKEAKQREKTNIALAEAQANLKMLLGLGHFLWWLVRLVLGCSKLPCFPHSQGVPQNSAAVAYHGCQTHAENVSRLECLDAFGVYRFMCREVDG